MSINLVIDNFASNNIKEKSTLAADVVAGATTVTPENIQGFGNGEFLLISKPGSEICEKRSITLSGANITVVALAFDHKKYAQLTSIYGDQIKIYRAANVDGHVPADSAFAALPSGIISIDVDQEQTTFTDPDGSSSYWYKYTYYHSVSTGETQLADAVAVRGGGYGHYATIDQIRAAAGFQGNTNITDGRIDEHRVAAEQEINGALNIQYAVPFTDPVPAVINNIARKLAAGNLLMDDYGPFAGNTGKSGKDLIEQAHALLDEIKIGKITLQDATGASIKQTQAVSFYPNTTNTDPGGDYLFKIGEEF